MSGALAQTNVLLATLMGFEVRLRQRRRRDAVQNARHADGAPRLSEALRRRDCRCLRGDHADDAARPRLRALRLSRKRFGGQALHGGHRAGLHDDDRPHDYDAFPLEALRLPTDTRPNGVAGRNPWRAPASELGAHRPFRCHLWSALRNLHSDRSRRGHRHLFVGCRPLRLSRAENIAVHGKS